MRKNCDCSEHFQNRDQMSELLIQHAKWQGELVKPVDSRLVSGKDCGCVCAGCGESLILRRGKRNRPHFAHHAKSPCDRESMIHNIVQSWVAQELPGSIIPLPPHPGLDSSYGFLVNANGAQTEFSENKRRYDIRLEGMFLYDFGVGDFNQDLAFKRKLEWLQGRCARRLREDEESIQEQFRQSGLPESWKKDYMEQYRPRIHPVILALVERDELKNCTYKGGLRSDKLDQLMIEVKYSHAKDDDFKLQMQKERRFVLEVNAEGFYGNGQNLTPVQFSKNSVWVWPDDQSDKGQMALFD